MFPLCVDQMVYQVQEISQFLLGEVRGRAERERERPKLIQASFTALHLSPLLHTEIAIPEIENPSDRSC